MKPHHVAILVSTLFACGGAQPSESLSAASRPGDGPASDAGAGPATGAGGEPATEHDPPVDEHADEGKDAGAFATNDSDETARPTQAKLQATDSEAALRLFVVDTSEHPIEGIVISLTSPAGNTYYTPETDGDGFTELLVPSGQTYQLVYLSLGRKDVMAKVEVANEPRLHLRLTVRYEREDHGTGPGIVLHGVQFESGKAKLADDSHPRLDAVVEYLTHKQAARIEISAHTDNAGNRRANKRLSQRRADAVRAYLVSKGIEASRITAVGYGDERPLAPNDTLHGRERNRRIEVTEL
jgi:outer membrane protein OmpA-like peptidoglycan-associated protein